jgi:hypothetical protein
MCLAVGSPAYFDEGGKFKTSKLFSLRYVTTWTWLHSDDVCGDDGMLSRVAVALPVGS